MTEITFQKVNSFEFSVYKRLRVSVKALEQQFDLNS